MSFDTLATELRGLTLMLREEHCTVLLRTSWWRRLRKKEQWAIALREPSGAQAEMYFIDDLKTPLSTFVVGECVVVEDPDKWPDEVCATVARVQLSE